MPAESKAQYRFMQGVKHGMKPRSGHGPSKKVAAEFVAATPNPSSLPERAGGKKPAKRAAKKRS